MRHATRPHALFAFPFIKCSGPRFVQRKHTPATAGGANRVSGVTPVSEMRSMNMQSLACCLMNFL